MFDPAPLIKFLKSVLKENAEVSIPLYKKLQRGIHKAIDDELISVDDALPSERDLAASLGMSRITVRKAITELAEDGVLIKRRGAGTFIKSRFVQPLNSLTSFSQDMAVRGVDTDIVWLDRSVGIASPLEVQKLNLSSGAMVSRLYRMRTVGEQTICLEHACLPIEFVPEPSLVKKSLYSFLESVGKKPVSAKQLIRAELFSVEQAHLIGVQPNSACLYIERQSFLADGTPVEYVCSHYRGDSYDFIAELNL